MKEDFIFKTFKDRVVIQMVEQKEKTAGGLFLPTTARKITIAKVIIQTEFTAAEIKSVAVGDKIVFKVFKE